MADFPIVRVEDDVILPDLWKSRCGCQSRIGDPHKSDCVCVVKKVRLKLEIMVEVDVPHFQEKEDIEFHYGESSWCANNIIDWMESHITKDQECLCDRTKVNFVETVDETPRVRIEK